MVWTYGDKSSILRCTLTDNTKPAQHSNNYSNNLILNSRLHFKKLLLISGYNFLEISFHKLLCIIIIIFLLYFSNIKSVDTFNSGSKYYHTVLQVL